MSVLVFTISSGCGTSCLRNDKICYQSLGDTELYEWDGISSTSLGPLMNFYELANDTINNLLYTSSTDFFSSGTINVYDVNNLVINTFACGVSPGVIVFDVRSSLCCFGMFLCPTPWELIALRGAQPFWSVSSTPPI